MVSEGPYGESVLSSDATTESVPSEDVAPPPPVGDITFEETRAGIEVWLSERIVRDHGSLIEGFMDWLREQPEVVSTDDDTPGVVQVKGALSEGLRTDVTAWWASRATGLELGS